MTTEQVIANGDHDNIVNTVTEAKRQRHWEIQMLMDTEFNWQAAAAAELERQAQDIIFSNLDTGDLMSIACGEVDIADLLKKV